MLPVSVEPLALRVAALVVVHPEGTSHVTSISRTRPVDVDCVAVTTALFTLDVAKEVNPAAAPAEKGLTAVREPPFIRKRLGAFFAGVNPSGGKTPNEL